MRYQSALLPSPVKDLSSKTCDILTTAHMTHSLSKKVKFGQTWKRDVLETGCLPESSGQIKELFLVLNGTGNPCDFGDEKDLALYTTFRFRWNFIHKSLLTLQTNLWIRVYLGWSCCEYHVTFPWLKMWCQTQVSDFWTFCAMVGMDSLRSVVYFK